MNEITKRLLLQQMHQGNQQNQMHHMNQMHQPDYRQDMAYQGNMAGADNASRNRNDMAHNDYGNDYANDYGNDYARNDMAGGGNLQGDGRQGVRGTGPYGMGGRDRHSDMPMKLPKREYFEWEKNLVNKDGSYGKHFNMQQIMAYAEKLGVRFRSYDERDLCMIVNVMYSDYCDTLKKYVEQSKHLPICIELARDWLEDDDGPEGSEKVILYYYCVVKNA